MLQPRPNEGRMLGSGKIQQQRRMEDMRTGRRRGTTKIGSRTWRQRERRKGKWKGVKDGEGGGGGQTYQFFETKMTRGKLQIMFNRPTKLLDNVSQRGAVVVGEKGQPRVDDREDGRKH